MIQGGCPYRSQPAPQRVPVWCQSQVGAAPADGYDERSDLALAAGKVSSPQGAAVLGPSPPTSAWSIDIAFCSRVSCSVNNRSGLSVSQLMADGYLEGRATRRSHPACTSRTFGWAMSLDGGTDRRSSRVGSVRTIVAKLADRPSQQTTETPWPHASRGSSCARRFLGSELPEPSCGRIVFRRVLWVAE